MGRRQRAHQALSGLPGGLLPLAICTSRPEACPPELDTLGDAEDKLRPWHRLSSSASTGDEHEFVRAGGSALFLWATSRWDGAPQPAKNLVYNSTHPWGDSRGCIPDVLRGWPWEATLFYVCWQANKKRPRGRPERHFDVWSAGYCRQQQF